MAARRALVVLIVLLTAGGLGLLLFPCPGAGRLDAAQTGDAGGVPRHRALDRTLPGQRADRLPHPDPVSRPGAGGVSAAAPPSGSGPGQALPRFAGAGWGPVGEAAPPTAIVVTVRNEDMRLVLASLRRLLNDLDAAGAADAFGVFILSDTLDPWVAATEGQQVAAFRAEDPDPGRIRYRRRIANTGFKAGNVMDFLDRHAEGFELMVTLDAEFRKCRPPRCCAWCRLIQADPSLAIVQHLTVGLPARAPSRGCSSSACGPGCGPGRRDRPGGRATRALTGGTTPSSVSPRSARTAGCLCCRADVTSCRTIRSRQRC